MTGSGSSDLDSTSQEESRLHIVIDLTTPQVANDGRSSRSSSESTVFTLTSDEDDDIVDSFDHTPNSSLRSTFSSSVQSSSRGSSSSPTPTIPIKRQKRHMNKRSFQQSHKDSVDLLDETDKNLYNTVQHAYPLLRLQTSEFPIQNLEEQFHIIDLTENDEQESAQVIEDESRFNSLTHAVTVIDLEVDDSATGVPPQHTILKGSTRIGSVKCATGKAVEFSDGSFMRIATVSQNSNGKFFLTGKVFLRQNSFRERVPKRRNEVILVGEVQREVCDNDLLRNRKLFLTNQLYPALSIRTHPDAWCNPEQDVHFGPLFCRWKRCTKLVGLRLEYESWQCLDEEEADPGLDTRIPSDAKRFFYRRCTTTPGGSFTETRPVVNLDNDAVENERVSQQYTFGDAFCGAGGTSCGAQMAGLKLMWSFDYDSKAAATYAMNFPAATCFEKPVHEFISMAKQDYHSYRVDVLHISPPCQPFSPAHTIASQQRDEMNQAALFSVGELIESVKPRIVTIEETEGLVSRHGEWFAALIHIFIRIGYSVSWRIIKCGDYGIPQPNRRRLMIIAAGPGEILPDFPVATHTPNPSGLLKKIPTIGDCIRNLEGLPNHDTAAALRTDRQKPFSPDTYAFTLTCNSGVGNYHPSGLRNYTIRELACLQTFPRNFQFANVGVTSQRRQIGNAVPPELAKALMKQIVQSLKRSDGLV